MAKKTKRTNPNYSLYTDIVSKNLDKVRELIEKGASHGDLAKYFEVNNATITLWKHKHPEFKAAIIEAKESRLIEQISKVEAALYKRALGYETEEVEEKFMMVDGQESIQKAIKKSKKHIPPDQKSIEFFLKNKDPENWEKSSSDVNIDMGGVLLVPDGDCSTWAERVKEQQKSLTQSAKEASDKVMG